MIVEEIVLQFVAAVCLSLPQYYPLSVTTCKPRYGVPTQRSSRVVAPYTLISFIVTVLVITTILASAMMKWQLLADFYKEMPPWEIVLIGVCSYLAAGIPIYLPLLAERDEYGSYALSSITAALIISSGTRFLAFDLDTIETTEIYRLLLGICLLISAIWLFHFAFQGIASAHKTDELVIGGRLTDSAQLPTAIPPPP